MFLVSVSACESNLHKSNQKPCEQSPTNLKLIEAWSQTLMQRELAKKRLAYAEEALDDYAFEMNHIMGPTQYNRVLEKYLSAIHGPVPPPK